MTKQDEIVQVIKVLRQEVEVLTTRLQPHGTGYLHTTIDTLNSRIDELIGEAITPYFNNPDNTLSPRELAHNIFNEPNSVRDAYLHSSRVKKDDVEHSPCYYDTERNRAVETDKSMKDKYGHAVHTVL